ncbi:MAG: diaminopimelate decarboxylase [Candidatus Acidiferrales bacterium]
MKPVRQSSVQRALDPAAFTPFFGWRASGDRRAPDGEVFCEEMPLRLAAESAGTPVYVYSRGAIETAFCEFDRALARLPHTVCYAVKANGNLSLLRLLARLGSGFDIVSGGELDRLRRIGVSGKKIVFNGVGKSREEIREALAYSPSGKARARGGILLFNVESEAELEILAEEAARNVARGGARPSVSIRVNPDVSAGGHPHISTGRHQHKFGVDWVQARRLYIGPGRSRWLEWRGISAHIGSQITSLAPFRRALGRLAGFVRELAAAGVAIDYLDFGGGLGVRYTDESLPSRAEYARAVAAMVRPLKCHLLLEPGRSIVAPAGVLLTRVLYTKQNRGKTFVIVDAAMNDLIRPALYGAVHPITRVTREGDGARSRRVPVDIAGPVCETGDCFLRDWPLEPVAPGDILAIWSTGAYGFVQSSNYNSRLRSAEVLVEGKRFRVIRRRESRADLVRHESGD